MTTSTPAPEIPLPRITQCVLAALRNWPGPHLTVGTLSAMVEADPEDVEAAIEYLQFEASLVLPLGDGQYAATEADRDGLPGLGSADLLSEWADSLARGIQHLLVTAAAADLRLAPHRPHCGWAYLVAAEADPPVFADANAALAWLDGEVDNLLCAQKTAATLGRTELAAAFCEVLEGWLQARRDDAVCEVVCTRGLAAARRGGHRMAETRALTLLARRFRARGHRAPAAKHACEAHTAARWIGDQMGSAIALVELAAIHLAADDPGEAIDACNAALDTIGTLPAGAWLRALARRRLGAAYARNPATLDRARNELALAAEAFVVLDEHEHGRTLTELGALELSVGQLDAALKALDQAISVLDRSGRPFSLAHAYTVLAQVHRADYDTEHARHCITRALETYTGANAPNSHPGHAAARRIAAGLAAART